MPFDQVNFVVETDTHLADILRAAWKKMAFYGLGKGSGGGPLSVCALQAVYQASRGHDSYLACRLLECALPPGFEYVMVYNDHPDTTLADMRALFLRAIDLVGG